MNDEINPSLPVESQEPKVTLKQRLRLLVYVIRRFALQNKLLAAVIALLIVFAISGGVFALVSRSDNPSTASDAKNTSSNGGLNEQNNGSSEQITPAEQQNGAPGSSGGTSSGGSSGSNNPGSSTPPAATTFAAPIGYIGGSLTVNARDGYAELGGTKFWVRASYGGGTIDKLADGINPSNDNHKYWNVFNNANTAASSTGPTKTFWLQLLGRSEHTDDAYYADSIAVINEIKNRLPGVTIYVSAMNGYTESGVCNLPASAPPQMQRVTDRLVNDGKALRGPVVGNLSNAQLEDSECHANAAGRAILGTALKNFFGL